MTNKREFEPLAVPVLAAGAILGIGRTKTLELTQSGELDSILIGRKRLILMASLHRYVEHRQAAQQ